MRNVLEMPTYTLMNRIECHSGESAAIDESRAIYPGDIRQLKARIHQLHLY